MSIKNIGPNCWLVRARVRQNGQVVSNKRKITGTREQALELDLKLKKELRSKPAENSSFTISTFGDALRYYQDHSEADLVKLQSLYDRMNEDLGNVPIGELSEKWPEYWKLLKRVRSPLTKRLLSPATRNRMFSNARTALNFCLKRNLISRNPLAVFEKDKGEEARDRVWTDEERARILNVLERQKSYLYWPVYFSQFNPIRKGDLANLTRENLDLFKPWVHFLPQKTRRKKKRETCLPFIDQSLMDYFRGLPAGCPYLFPRIDESGNWHQLGDFKKHWQGILEQANVDDFHWHDLKHCAITWILDSGYSERDLKNLGIQYAPAMVDRYYKHDAAKVLRKWKSANSAVAVAPDCGPKCSETA